MEREIKFKRVFQHEETGVIITTEWGRINVNNISVYDFSSFKSPSTMSRYYPIADVQFTGFCDKNNEEIYEGDIVKFIDRVTIPNKPEECITEVFWWDVMACFALKNTHTEFNFTIVDEMEVIGNIYENPELL